MTFSARQVRARLRRLHEARSCGAQGTGLTCERRCLLACQHGQTVPTWRLVSDARCTGCNGLFSLTPTRCSKINLPDGLTLAAVCSGDVLTALNGDTQAFQDAISIRVGNTIHHVTTFVGGIVIALIYGWKLTLVMLSLTPFLGLAGMFLAKVMTKGAAPAVLFLVPSFLVVRPLNSLVHWFHIRAAALLLQHWRSLARAPPDFAPPGLQLSALARQPTASALGCVQVGR